MCHVKVVIFVTFNKITVWMATYISSRNYNCDLYDWTLSQNRCN